MSDPSSSANPIRVGVIGLGFGQVVHAPALAQVPGVRVTALAGRDAAKVDAARAKLGVPRGYDSWQRLLEREPLEAISIAVPPQHQPAIVEAAAARGVAVYCEKPTAADVAGAARMLEAVTRHGVAHAVNFIFPEAPAWHEAQRVLASWAAAGRIRRAALTWRVETYATRHKTTGWKRSSAEGGGTLNNFVSHSAYYLEHLLGPITRLRARLHMAAETDGDDAADAWLDFAGGFSATLSVATDCPCGSGHRLEVYSDDGALILDNPTKDYIHGFTLRAPTRDQTDPAPLPLPAIDTGGADGRVWATRQIAARFVGQLRGGAATSPNLAHGLRVQRLLEAMRASHQSQQVVEVPRGQS